MKILHCLCCVFIQGGVERCLRGFWSSTLPSPFPTAVSLTIFQPQIGRKIKILQLRSEKKKKECNSIKCYLLPSYSILQTSQIDEFPLNKLCSCLDRNMLIYILITT